MAGDFPDTDQPDDRVLDTRVVQRLQPQHVVVDGPRDDGRSPALCSPSRLPALHLCPQGGRVRRDEHRRQVRDLHVLDRAADVAAMAVQHGYLVSHGFRIAEQVASIRVLDGQTQCAPLAGTTDEDGHPTAEWPRVGQCFRDLDAAAGE